MWSDSRCVDHTGADHNVRRILGLRTSGHGHKWNTNSYMSEMNSVQLRFLSRNSNRSTRASDLCIIEDTFYFILVIENTFLSRNSSASMRVLMWAPLLCI